MLPSGPFMARDPRVSLDVQSLQIGHSLDMAGLLPPSGIRQSW